jgi:carboxypeptidase Taq
MNNYRTLEKVFKKLSDIEQAQSVLHWDMSVMMPTGGAESRANQLATLKSIGHAIITDNGVKSLIEGAKGEVQKLNSAQKANLNEMERSWIHASAVSHRLVTDLSHAGSKCEMIWREARKSNDFKSYAPYLKKVVEVSREIAKVKAEALNCSPYEALLDQYDPGRKEAQLDSVFENLQGFLPEFTAKVVEKQKATPPTPLKGPFSIEKQRELSKELLNMVGFDMETGRLDESIHPFCTGSAGDVRITTRYDENDFSSGVMGVLHEFGHAQYEAGLPFKWRGQPVGQAMGMSIHESQSLLIEMQVCRSKGFLKQLLPIVKKTLGGKGKGWSVDNFTRLAQKVEPSLIRVDADEVTYPSHIMLRYYTEKFLISGDMEVEDLPDAWAQGMEKFLGIRPENDKDGCMQDIHWTDGSFGYFPTYTLGAIYAAQIADAAVNADPAIVDGLSKCDFAPLKTWLGENIHKHGSKYSADELIKKATGSSLDVEIYKQYLTARYL